MIARRKILLVLCLCLVFGLLAVLGVGFYYYSNPSKLKSLAEGALSRFTGTECSIKEITYSRHPLVIRAKGIQFIEHIQGFYLEIPELVADMSLEGSFGRRSLVFNDLRVPALSLTMNQLWQPADVTGDVEEPSFFRRILGGLFSFFLVQDVKVRQARLEEGHVTGQWKNGKINLNRMHAQLRPGQFLEIGCGVRIQSLSDQVDIKISRLKIITDGPIFPLNALIPAKVRGEEVAIETPQAQVTNALMEAKILYSQGRERVAFESFKISFDGISLNESGTARFVPLRSLIEAAGDLDLQQATLAAPRVHAVLGTVAEFRGEFRAGFGGEFAVSLAELKAMPQNLFPLLPGSLKTALDPFSLNGAVLVSGRLGGNLGQDIRQWACDLKAQVRDNMATLVLPGLRFQTRVTGDVQAKGALSSLETLVTADCADSALQAGTAQFDRGAISLSLGGTFPNFDLKALNFHVPGAKWEAKGRELHLEEIEGQTSSGRLDVAEKTLQLPELILETSTLKNLSLSADIAQDKFSVAAMGKDVHLVEFLQAMKVIPQAWKIRSADSLHAQAALGGEGRLAVSSKMEIQGLSFESPDGRCLGENLSLVVEPSLEGTLAKNSSLTGVIFLYIPQGEVLYDRFYLDLSKHPLVSDGKASFQDNFQSAELSDFTLQLGNLAVLTAQGKFSSETSQEPGLSVHLAKTPLAPLFRLLVAEPYQHQSPLLGDLRLNGFFSADAEMAGRQGRWTLKGHAFWQEGAAVLEREEISLEGIDMDFPLWYEAGAEGTEEKKKLCKSPDELEGFFSIRSLQVPLLPAQPIDIPLRAAPDRLSTLSPFSLTVAGGQIELGRILLMNPFSGTPEMETKITIPPIDLGPWLSRIWPGTLQGTLRGKLDPVRWEDGTLRTMGEITADLFGGQITLSNIEGWRTLSLAPTIRLDAAWEGLHLADMTHDTAFGKIEGTLRGSIKGLELSGGQPQKFELFTETVKKKDIPQKISVRAVDNIARIGGGASPFIGVTGAFVSFFKELPYEKIGLKASLENDLFKINGTIEENGREYLVKKGGFSGVDVIIGTPGSNTISFKDMVKRIKRVTASQEGPVVD